tara:strand:- start:133 stop:903 length:771 start_codon:yes stop_codon:yes gene_type:complete
MRPFRQTFQTLTGSALLRGLFAFGSAEAATRVIRLGALLIVARRVTPEIFGTAALALSVFELVRVLANAGIGQRLITATDAELPALCRTAYRLFWMLCLGVAAVQLAAAAVLAAVFDLPQVGQMLAALSLVYYVMPPGLVQIFLTMRAMRMPAVARIAATQNIVDSALTVSLVLIWPTAWAIVLPKLLAAPVWTVLARRSTRWTNSPAVSGSLHSVTDEERLAIRPLAMLSKPVLPHELGDVVSRYQKPHRQTKGL